MTEVEDRSRWEQIKNMRSLRKLRKDPTWRSARMKFVQPAPPKPVREITRQQAKDSTRAKRARAQSLADRTAE